MAIKRGPVDIKRGGRGDGSGENQVFHSEDGILPYSDQDAANLPTVAEVIVACYGGNEDAFLSDVWNRVIRTVLPESEQLPTFWSIFWTQHLDKLIKPESGSVEKDNYKSAAENTANARKTFAIRVSGLSKEFGSELATEAEAMIARVK